MHSLKMTEQNQNTGAFKVLGVTRKLWNGMYIVKISDVPGFRDWLYGQTQPWIHDDEGPSGWAYYDDFYRYTMNLPIID